MVGQKQAAEWAVKLELESNLGKNEERVMRGNLLIRICKCQVKMTPLVPSYAESTSRLHLSPNQVIYSGNLNLEGRNQLDLTQIWIISLHSWRPQNLNLCYLTMAPRSQFSPDEKSIQQSYPQHSP